MRRIVGITLVAGLALTSAPASAGPLLATRHSRHAAAVTEAKRLLGRSPTTTTEMSVSTAPRRKMRKAPQLPEFDQLVTRSRFWTSDQPLHATYATLTHDTPPGMRFTGSGGGLAKDGRLSDRYASYAPNHLPRTIASASLTVEVVRDGDGRSAVGVYAQVVPRPKRPRNEHVPLALQTVELQKINLETGSVVKQRTVTGRRAQTLVRRFDQLRVTPPGGSSCGKASTAIRATFQARGHTWQVEYPYCNSVSVMRDGHRLPDLDVTLGFLKHLRNDLR